MFNRSTRQVAAVLASLTTLAVGVSQVHGQVRSMGMRGAMMPQPFLLNPVTSNRMGTFFPSSTSGFSPNSGFGNLGFTGSPVNPFTNPYGGISGYPYGLGAMSLYGGYLGLGSYNSGYGGYGSSNQSPYGGGDGIGALDRLIKTEQQAPLIKEQARTERLANRRRLFDEYLHERDMTPTAEAERQRHEAEQLKRALNNPPVTEIWSGQALNTILADLRKLAAQSTLTELPTFSLTLGEDDLKRINVTRGAGNIALLKDSGRLLWPVALGGPEYQEERARLGALAWEAVFQARLHNRVDAELLQQINAEVVGLHELLRANGKDLYPSQYIEAKTFLNHFDDALRALQERDVGNHFTGAYDLRAQTAAEIVQQMSAQGLVFAPALPGDRAAYVLLHEALAKWDRAAQLQTAAR